MVIEEKGWRQKHMVNFDTEYPFPVLRSEPVDYKSSIFLTKVSVTPSQECYIFHTNLDIKNNEVRELIEKGIAQPGVYIQCDSTWMRKIEPVKLGEYEFKVKTSNVRGRVNFCPVITAASTIKDFHSDDFAEEYNSIKIVIHPGDPLAIGKARHFDAVYAEDLLKKGDPIIIVTTEYDSTDMTFDFESDAIKVVVPKKWMDAYSSMKITKRKYPLLSALYYLPAVTESVRCLRDDEDKYIDYVWARTVKDSLMQLAGGNDRKYQNLLQMPFQTAQKLIGGMDEAILALASWVIEERES